MKRQLAFGLGTLSCAMMLSLSAVSSYAGDSGCGLGSVVIQKNSKLLQLFSMTTNATFFSQAFGITSGTSGCSASGIVMNDKAIEYFAEVNKDDLSREMAVGRGEKLMAFASLHGCTQEGQREFAARMQKSLAEILPQANTSAQEMVDHVRATVASDPQLSRDCPSVVSSL